MRIAVLPVGIHLAGRSADLQELLGTMLRSLSVRPAPELVIVPIAGPSHADSSPADAVLQRTLIVESLAWMARDWGVYVLAALTEGAHDDLASPTVLLIDPDGDVRNDTSRPCMTAEEEGSGTGGEASPDVRKKPVRRIETEIGAIVPLSDPSIVSLLTQPEMENALVVVPFWHAVDSDVAQTRMRLIETVSSGQPECPDDTFWLLLDGSRCLEESATHGATAVLWGKGNIIFEGAIPLGEAATADVPIQIRVNAT